MQSLFVPRRCMICNEYAIPAHEIGQLNCSIHAPSSKVIVDGKGLPRYPCCGLLQLGHFSQQTRLLYYNQLTDKILRGCTRVDHFFNFGEYDYGFPHEQDLRIGYALIPLAYMATDPSLKQGFYAEPPKGRVIAQINDDDSVQIYKGGKPQDPIFSLDGSFVIPIGGKDVNITDDVIALRKIIVNTNPLAFSGIKDFMSMQILEEDETFGIRGGYIGRDRTNLTQSLLCDTTLYQPSTLLGLDAKSTNDITLLVVKTGGETAQSHVIEAIKKANNFIQSRLHT